MFKKFSLLFLLVQHLCWSQDFSKNWKSHFSYNNIVAVDASDSKIYAAANNSLFVHSIQENSNTEITTVDGLSAEDIQVLKYIDDSGLIVIGFKNGLIEIIDENTKEITSLNDIPSTSNFPADQIKINDIFEDSGILYIATGFGIVEYDLKQKVFINTYLISDSLSIVSDVISVGIIGDTIVTSIEGRGSFLGNKKDQNLILFENWTPIPGLEYEQFNIFSGQLIARDSDTAIHRFNGVNFESVYSDTSKIINFNVSGNELLLTLEDKIIKLNANFNIIEETILPDELLGSVFNSLSIDNEIYFSSVNKGFIKTQNKSFTNTININPEGPESNDIYELDAHNGDVWVVHGKLDEDYSFASPRNQGVSRLRSNEWFNIPFSEINKPYIVNTLINKQDKDIVYFSSYGGGLLEYNGSTNSFLVFDNENSNIDEVSGFSAPYDLEFSPSNELWLINMFSPRLAKPLTKNAPTNTNDPDFSSVIPETTFSIRAESLAFSQQGNVFIGSWLQGLIGYNSTTNKIIKLVDEEANNIPFVTVRTIAFGLDGELWIGTNNGLRVIQEPDRLFEESTNNLKAESIIFLDDGVPQELLFQQFISDISVDADNNKWVATQGAGLFQFSPNGEETLKHFTTANSSIPSNNINKIVIDNSTGSVFIGTNKGLIEFKSNIIEAQENFDQFKIFPNPVRPEYGEVVVKIEGLTAGANVKITDIEGNLVFEDQNATINGSGSGLIEWDTKSFSGTKVASGVYLILITSEDQLQTKIGKLLIVR